ncbi:U3 small nucleolar RNA-associated protein 25 homolog [Watersipora subatra]|uniref:U3 small nucleolar RNA-associated protein 25 homolog n=1 Tax=Watersipora subatra TaxID=2589382 RepID=UPI00355AFF89
MSKGRPKISRADEENQSMALFDESIPSVSGRGKTAKRVYEGVENEEAQESSSSESSEEEEDAVKKLMSELRAADADLASSDSVSSSIEEDDEESGNGENSSDAESDSDMNDDSNMEDDSEYIEESEKGESKDDTESGLARRKRTADLSGEEESLDDSAEESGSADELSLAESSLEEAERDTVPLKDVPTKKRKKALDDAVDPDYLADSDKKNSKPKSLVKETIKADDPFTEHFEKDMEESAISLVLDRKLWKTDKIQVEQLGHVTYSHSSSAGELRLPTETTSLPSLGVRSRLFNLVGKTLRLHCNRSKDADREPSLTPEQRQLFCIINQYKDLYNPRQTFENMEDYRLVYCLHALNHILKTRLRVTLNSEEKWSAERKKTDVDVEYRDQGLTRPKVLILAPFKESARRILNIFESLLMTKKKSFVTNKKRFTEEFSPLEDASIDPKKPEDYVRMFDGNTDDCFRLGVQLSKSGMKLYANFYKADVLICSPLGLRMILGAEGDEKQDYDFMSSIEVLIMDQADVFLMQNWDHVLHLLSLLHVQPKGSHDTDFSRIRMWTLNGHAKHYRQTIVQSSVYDPHLAAIFAKHCSNYAGEVRLQPLPSTGSICHITSAMPLIFQRFHSVSYSSLPDDRFDYFTREVLPQFTDKQRAGTLIYIPSYYDYVRIRNYLAKHKHETSLVCEYASDKAIRRAKKKFFTKETQFMLYTERVHFFRRMQLRKIRHLIFYSLPTYPQFFSDMCNMYKTGGQADASCTVLFSNQDAYKLSVCVGTERTKHMVNAKKNVFMFVTGDD